MAQTKPTPDKTKIRRTVVNTALAKLLQAMEKLDDRESLEQQVFISYQLSPESFDNLKDYGDGAVLLRFVRSTEFSDWQLDKDRFLILEDE